MYYLNVNTSICYVLLKREYVYQLRSIGTQVHLLIMYWNILIMSIINYYYATHQHTTINQKQTWQGSAISDNFLYLICGLLITARALYTIALSLKCPRCLPRLPRLRCPPHMPQDSQ